MIHTIVSSGQLYRVHRDRAYLQLQAHKKRAFRLAVGIFTCTAILVYIWILR